MAMLLRVNEGAIVTAPLKKVRALAYGSQLPDFSSCYPASAFRAQRDAGVLGDSGLSAEANGGTSIPIGERDSLSIAATFRGQEYHRYTVVLCRLHDTDG